MSTTFSLYDLSLLHDFTLSSYATVARRDTPVLRDIWQKDVPQLGLHHPYLMHAILSFAATHRMHHPSQDSRLDDRAHQAARDHYDQALVGMRASVSAITKELADPVLCFSILICFVTLFLAAVDGLEPIDIALDLFGTVRSTMGILSHDIIREHLKESRIGTLIRHDNAAAATRNDLPEGLCDSLDWILAASSQQNISSGSAEYNRILMTAAVKLKHMFTLTTTNPESWDHLLSWPISLVPELPELMRAIEQHEPAALCILAHWCVPLCNAPPKWFVEDWPRMLLKTIQNELAETPWAPGMKWTLAKVPGYPGGFP